MQIAPKLLGITWLTSAPPSLRQINISGHLNFNPADIVPAENERSLRALSGGSNGKGQDIADVALQQLVGQDS